ncbi:MAG TPA: transporter substrate-binding domain-containing protein, partial [Rectinemataceae bacterium]|nr:transporter substrate-binding domain-containing protein [Rectinemataceae bacterium]
MAGRHCLRYTDSSVMRLARPTAIFIALLAASSLSPPRSDAQAATITLGYYDAKPSCFRDERGEPRGVFIDILKEVARREGWHPVFRFETWDELLEGLKSGSADLVPAIVRTEARDRFAVFTEESVMSDWGAVFSRPGSGLSSILDLGGKRVGALENDFWFSGPGSLKELCSSFGVTPDYRYFADYSALFHALANGDIDAAAGSNSLGIIWTPQLPVVATSIVYNPIELRFAASRAAPGGPALIEELDRNLAAIRQDSPEVFSS